MNEPICAVCGETDIKKLTMFNYGVCLCHRCLEISAHSFIHDNVERKLKETEKKKESVDVEGMSKQEYESMKELKDEIAKKIWDEITEKIKKKREADANRYQKRYDELCEEFRIKYKVCNTWMLVASAAGLLVGVALGYGLQ